MKKVYVAFSIHGTNKFITATNEVMDSVFSIMTNTDFSIVRSRRPEYKSDDGIKLHWKNLMTKDGTPLRSPPMIIKRFRELEKMGFKIIGLDDFVSMHWKKAA